VKPQDHGVQPSLRFVVGSLTSIEQAVKAIADLKAHHLAADAIAILAKEDLLARDPQEMVALDGSHVAFDLLKSHSGRILCFGQSLGALLRSRVNAGSKNLKEALQRWLLPRHAGGLSEIVEKNGILIWVEIKSPEEEHAASLSLLRTSRGTVEVHDFVMIDLDQSAGA
jgi:hypothetical protein